MKYPVLIVVLGLLASMLVRPAQALVILQYHHVSEKTPPATSISPARFEAHLRLIADAGFQVLDLDTVIGLVRSGRPLPDRSVLITFDDSYSTIYEEAFPRLRARNWPFVVFVSTEPLDMGLRGSLDWPNLRTMAANGAAIANHSVSHPHMVRRREDESTADWQRRISREILAAEKRILAEVGQSHRVLAYPYGESGAELQALVHSLGFVAMGQHSGAASPQQALALPRFAFGGDYGDEADFLTKLYSLPLEFDELLIRDEEGTLLADGVLPLDVRRPVVEIHMRDPDRFVDVRCYASGQGATDRQQKGPGVFLFQAKKPLALGRTRYNCTAQLRDSGRFQWDSVLFLSRTSQGLWPQEP